eukprot:COSAG01_NODE_7555_length_3164_cov_15.727392_3_plen_87_part_00
MVAEMFASVRMQRFHSLTWLHIAFRAARTVGRWSISWSDQYVNLQREGTITTIPGAGVCVKKSGWQLRLTVPWGPTRILQMAEGFR